MGGGSIGGSKSGSSNSSGFGQEVFSPQGSALGNAYSQLGNLAGKSGKGASNQMQGGQQYSADSMASAQQPWKNQMAGGAYGGSDWNRMMTNSINQMQGRGSSNEQQINEMIMGGAGNDYADAMKSNYMQDATDLKNQSLGLLDTRAAAAGMSGGSGHGDAIGRAFEGIDKNTQMQLGSVGFNTFDKDLDRKLAIARNADTNLFNRDVQNQNTIANMMGGYQNSMNTGIGNTGNMVGYGQNQQMMPWQQAGSYMNAIGAPTVLSSGQGSGSSSSKGKGASGGK